MRHYRAYPSHTHYVHHVYHHASTMRGGSIFGMIEHAIVYTVISRIVGGFFRGHTLAFTVTTGLVAIALLIGITMWSSARRHSLR